MSVTMSSVSALCICMLVVDHICATENKFEILVTDHGHCIDSTGCSFTYDHPNIRRSEQLTDKYSISQCSSYTVSEKEQCILGPSTGIIETVLQDPRSVAVRKGWNIRIECSNVIHNNYSWVFIHRNGSVIKLPDSYMSLQRNYLTITKVQKHHSGVYFCKYNTSEGEKTSPCGTELLVMDCGNPKTAKSRNTMKDAIIMIQTILIVIITLVPVLILMEMKKKRSLKIEDHTYEGLEAYQTATYEDIQNVRVLSAKIMEAEHPCVQ